MAGLVVGILANKAVSRVSVTDISRILAEQAEATAAEFGTDSHPRDGQAGHNGPEQDGATGFSPHRSRPVPKLGCAFYLFIRAHRT